MCCSRTAPASFTASVSFFTTSGCSISMSCIHSEMKPPGMNGSSVMCIASTYASASRLSIYSLIASLTNSLSVTCVSSSMYLRSLMYVSLGTFTAI